MKSVREHQRRTINIEECMKAIQESNKSQGTILSYVINSENSVCMEI